MMELLSKIATPVYAQQVKTTPLSTGISFGSVSELFYWVTNAILILGTGVVLVMLALGFMQYVISRGDPKAIEKAQQWVTYAAIGGIGMFMVYALRTVMIRFIGAEDPLEGGTP